MRAVGVGLLLGVLAAVPLPARCQDGQADVQRNLLEREQRQQEFLLRQRQYEESRNPQLNAEQRRQLEARHLEQRQRQQELELRQIQRFEQERQAGSTQPATPGQKENQRQQQEQQWRREQDSLPGR